QPGLGRRPGRGLSSARLGGRPPPPSPTLSATLTGWLAGSATCRHSLPGLLHRQLLGRDVAGLHTDLVVVTDIRTPPTELEDQVSYALSGSSSAPGVWLQLGGGPASLNWQRCQLTR